MCVQGPSRHGCFFSIAAAEPKGEKKSRSKLSEWFLFLFLCVVIRVSVRRCIALLFAPVAPPGPHAAPRPTESRGGGGGGVREGGGGGAKTGCAGEKFIAQRGGKSTTGKRKHLFRVEEKKGGNKTGGGESIKRNKAKGMMGQGGGRERKQENLTPRPPCRSPPRRARAAPRAPWPWPSAPCATAASWAP